MVELSKMFLLLILCLASVEEGQGCNDEYIDYGPLYYSNFSRISGRQECEKFANQSGLQWGTAIDDIHKRFSAGCFRANVTSSLLSVFNDNTGLKVEDGNAVFFAYHNKRKPVQSAFSTVEPLFVQTTICPLNEIDGPRFGIQNSPYILLILPERLMIDNVTIHMNQESVDIEVKAIEVLNDTEDKDEILRHCGVFKASGHKNRDKIIIQCSNSQVADMIKIQFDTGSSRKHPNIMNVTFGSRPYSPKTEEDVRQHSSSIMICSVAALILVAVVIGAVLFYKRKVKAIEDKLIASRQLEMKELLAGHQDQLNPYMSINQQIENLAYNFRKYEINKNYFTIQHKIGDGQFGLVSLGTITDLCEPSTGTTQVAIKQVKNTMDHQQMESIIGELKIMSNLGSHPNLVNLLAACTSEISNNKFYILLEYCELGDLKKILTENRDAFLSQLKSDDITDAQFKPRQLLNWCYHIAKGMEYLESKKVMHGDLAARNVLVDEEFVAKISDFGLSKQMYYEQSYKKMKRRMIPWAWMSLEYLETGEFNLKSDVWSFGVLVWEIYTLGNKPYGIEPFEEIKKKLKCGERLPIPEHLKELEATHDIYAEIMLPCWKAQPEERLNFKEIVKFIEKILDRDEVEKYCQMAKNFNALQEVIANARIEKNENMDNHERNSEDAKKCTKEAKLSQSRKSVPNKYSIVKIL